MEPLDYYLYCYGTVSTASTTVTELLDYYLYCYGTVSTASTTFTELLALLAVLLWTVSTAVFYSADPGRNNDCFPHSL